MPDLHENVFEQRPAGIHSSDGPWPWGCTAGVVREGRPDLSSIRASSHPPDRPPATDRDAHSPICSDAQPYATLENPAGLRAASADLGKRAQASAVLASSMRVQLAGAAGRSGAAAVAAGAAAVGEWRRRLGVEL